MARTTGRDVPKYIFHVQPHSELGALQGTSDIASDHSGHFTALVSVIRCVRRMRSATVTRD